jgi:hypothetical protein
MQGVSRWIQDHVKSKVAVACMHQVAGMGTMMQDTRLQSIPTSAATCMNSQPNSVVPLG